MDSNEGSIRYDARIDTSKMRGDAREAEAIAEGVADKSEGSAERTSQAWSRAAKVGIGAAIVGLTALAAGAVKATTASWEQVGAVEQATVGLKAYEKNGDAVNAVLSDLIKYARSDMGVLFNRRDLFQSAQMLKLNGVETKDLSANVQILSRSVGLGLGNWQDLNAVVGRVVSTGRLSGIEFDQLTQYGFKLDKSLRNTNISASDLFKTLDKGIPVDALQGQATTIRGLGIRIESAFRSIGDAILGVDADTSKFIKGGLGDLIVGLMDKLPAALKVVSAELRLFIPQLTSFGVMMIQNIGQIAVQIGNYLLPKIQVLITTLRDDFLPAALGLAKAIGPTVGTGLVWAFGLAIDALNALLAVATPVLNYLADHTWIIYTLTAAFVALKVSLAIGAAVQAIVASFALVSATAATTTGVLGTLRLAMLALTTPIYLSMFILGTALVIAEIEAVIKTVNKLSEAWSDAEKKKVPIGNTGGSASGGLSMVQQLKNSFGFRAKGGPVSAGKGYIVGEEGPEFFSPKSSGMITPNDALVDSTERSGGSHIENNIGTIVVDSQAREDAIIRRLTLNQETVSNGLVPKQAYA